MQHGNTACTTVILYAARYFCIQRSSYVCSMPQQPVYIWRIYWRKDCHGSITIQYPIFCSPVGGDDKIEEKVRRLWGRRYTYKSEAILWPWEMSPIYLIFILSYNNITIISFCWLFIFSVACLMFGFVHFSVSLKEIYFLPTGKM
jgi:hypothetical protein